MATLRDLAIKAESVPVLKPVLAWYYDRVFAGNGWGMFRGVYRDFQEALQAAPKTKKLGFDNEESVTMFQDRMTRIFPEDYPVLFWLRPCLSDGCSVFDFGGHRGHHFYAYKKYLPYPEQLNWTVCEVPVVVKAGSDLAEQRGEHRLHFTGDFSCADGATVLLAAGSLQYVDNPALAEALSSLRRLPKQLILNKLPLCEGKSFVTLQNGRVAFHALHVYNRREFVGSLNDLGYALVDEWPVPTRPGRIPFHPEASFPTHTGMFFRKD